MRETSVATAALAVGRRKVGRGRIDNLSIDELEVEGLMAQKLIGENSWPHRRRSCKWLRLRINRRHSDVMPTHPLGVAAAFHAGWWSCTASPHRLRISDDESGATSSRSDRTIPRRDSS